MLYLETRWASLIPFAKVADLLKEVLPVAPSTNHETVREHLQATAERMEQELGEYLHPNSEHLIDWFHITMRLTVLQQQTKSLRAEQEQR